MGDGHVSLSKKRNPDRKGRWDNIQRPLYLLFFPLCVMR
jgi:hypothetical protein